MDHETRHADSEDSGLTTFGREWRAGTGSELVAATIRIEQFGGPEHAHPEAQVAILLSGSSATFSRRSISGIVTSPISPGSFVYIPPGELHRTHWQSTTELLNLYWEDEYLRALADRNDCSLHERPVSYRADPAMQSIGRIFMDEFIWTGSVSPMMIDHARALAAARLFHLSNQRSRRFSTGLLSAGRLRPAADAMNAYPERSFTLMELAQLCNASVFHFAHSFTASMGCPPVTYERNLRVQKARELLSSTQLSIEMVAAAVGIEDAKSFSRVFRRSTGWARRDDRRLSGMGPGATR